MLAQFFGVSSRRWCAWPWGLVLLGGMAHAQTAVDASAVVGEVSFSKGVGFAQSPGQGPRTLGAGLPLKEGDRLTTAASGTAIVLMKDGTRMTVRPQSELLLEQYRFKAAAPQDNSMVLNLVKGGFRAVTGLINKHSDQSARIKTSTATIGIRGTDFDARICQNKECAGESKGSGDGQRTANLRASAKAVVIEGDVHVVGNNGDKRRLSPGGSIYPGDMVETGARAQTMLAFRDESKLTLGATTRFRIDDFTFDAKNPKDGRFLVSLLKGTARTLTGLIGKAGPQNVGFKTATATIGIRGTGFDVLCEDDTSIQLQAPNATATATPSDSSPASGLGRNFDESCSFFNWSGSISVTPEGHGSMQVLEAGQGMVVSPRRIAPLPSSPVPADLPRPDSVPVDMGPLFTATPIDEAQEGLYVFVRDGHLEVTTIQTQRVLHLGRGEVGLAMPDGTAVRPLLMPRFIELDRTPLPNHPNPLLATVLGDAGVRSSNVCR